MPFHSRMMLNQTIKYQVIHSPAFDAEYLPLEERYPRLDQIVGVCCWALTRQPREFECLDSTLDLWAIRTTDDMWGELPQFDIGYQIAESPKEVILLTIEAVTVW